MAGALDPQIAAWLRDFPPPSVDYRDVAAVRRLTQQYMAEQGGPAPRWSRDDVVLTEIAVGGVPALAWRPRDSASHDRLPVVIAFHGGAFIVGHPLGAERIAVPLAAEHGVMTVSVGYRLAPEHRAPAARDDARAAFAGVGELPGADAERIALHGSSAGAALAAGLALHARDADVAVRLQSLSCPALDSRSPATVGGSMAGDSPTLSRDSVEAMWEHYLGPRESRESDLRHVVPALCDDVSGVAPAHITVAEFDVLRDEAIEYADRLATAGVAVDVDLVPGTVHGFDGLLPDCDVAREAIRRQVTALAEALGD
jgi:acetyl esterase/lipase